MPSKTSLEAVNTAGPFVSEYELAQQTGIAHPKIWVIELPWELGEVWSQSKFTCLTPGSGPKYVRIKLDPTKLSG